MRRALLSGMFLGALLLANTGCAGCEDSPDAAPDAGGLEDLTPSMDMSPGADDGVLDMAPSDDGGGSTMTPDLDPDTGGGDRPDLEDMRSNFPIDLEEFDFGAPDDQGGMLAPLAIANVSPSRGPVAGDTPFAIDGAGFTAQTQVFFGSKAANGVELVDGVLVGQTPAADGPGPVTVRLLDPDQGSVSLQDGYTYTPTLTVSMLDPARVPVAGGIEIDVRGTGFDAFTRVSLGGATALRHTLVDATLLRVLAPPHAAGPVDVRLTNRDGSLVVPDGVTYFEPLAVHAVKPASGPLSGRFGVSVVGEGFEPGMQVFFGSLMATVETVEIKPDLDVATVHVPATSLEGLVDVRVVTPSNGAVIFPDGYLYTASPEALDVALVTPSSGPLAGGQLVTILGSGFEAGVTSVRFDGKLATIVDQDDGYLLVATPPGSSPGVVDLEVDTIKLDDAYTYLSAFSITSIAPSSGQSTGQETVTITGEGLDAATQVLFGASPALQITSRTPTSLEVVTPPHPVGEVDVVLRRGDEEVRLEDGFEYLEDTELYGFSPVRGSMAGGTYVLFRGQNLAAVSEILFGAEPAVSMQLLDAQTIAVKTPAAMLPGAVDVSLLLEDGSAILSPQRFLYFNPGARFGGAWGGSVQGAVNVTVYSQGGGPIENAFVMLSARADTQYQGLTDANGMVTLSGPDVYGEQSVTAIAAGFSSATVQRVDAENITIFLSPPPNPGMPPGGPLPATFRGQLTGLNKLVEPGPSQFPMAVVFTTQVNTGTPNPDPGSQSTLLSDGEYVITTRLGDLAIVALGGLYDNATQRFIPLRMGVKRYLFASEGMVYTNVDIDLDIALDQTLSVKMNNAPSSAAGPSGKQIQTWMDFGFEGVFGALPLTTGSDAVSLLQIEHLPQLSGQLQDVSLYIEAGTYTNNNAPYSIGLLRNVTMLNRILSVNMLDVPRMTSPQEGARPLDNLISFSYDSPLEPDLFYVRIQTFMQEPRWEGFLPGDAREIRLPTFPDFSALPPEQRPTPYGNEPLVLLIIGVKQPGLNFDQFDYTLLNQEEWEAYSVSVHTITL